MYSHSFPNLPQEYRPTELLPDLLKSFTKGALQWFTPTSLGVSAPSFHTRLPTITPQTICVTSVMSSFISSARWSQRSCSSPSYPSYPDHGHPTPDSKGIGHYWIDRIDGFTKAQANYISLVHIDLEIQNRATCSRYGVASA